MRFERYIARAVPATAVGLLVLAAVGGCQAAHVSQPPLTAQIAPTPAAGNASSAQIEFWHALGARPLTSNDDALHGLLLYFDGKDDATDYAARVEALKARKWLPAGFKEPADQAVRRGTVAEALCRALKFKGGVTMRLLGPTPRYALRELEYRGLLPDSSPNQGFSGAEFVGVMGKVEDLRTGNPADVPADTLPEEVRVARGGAADLLAPRISVIPFDAADLAEDDRVDPALKLAADPTQLTLANPILASMMADGPVTTTTTTAPAAEAGELVATVIKVQGTVEFRINDAAKWEPLTAGKTLRRDASIRTGARGAVVMTVPPDQTIGVDRLTTATVLEAYQKQGKVTTDVGMKYGRVRYDIAGAGVEHEATIRSPNSNLAIRGTKVSLFDQRPYTPEAVSLTGRAQFSTLRRQAVAFGNKGQGKTVVRSDSAGPAQFAVAQAVVDPGIEQARTSSEEALINTLILRGADVSIENGIRVVRGGGRPTDAQLQSSLPGVLNFVVRWDGPANLDLAVSTPNFPDGHSEFIYPIGGLDRSRSGGVIPFDHRGGKGGGIEVVYWPANTFTSGTYAMSVQRVSGPPVTATIEAFLNKQALNLDPDALKPVTQVSKIVSADSGAVQFVDVPTQLPTPQPEPNPNGNGDNINGNDGTVLRSGRSGRRHRDAAAPVIAPTARGARKG